MAPASSKRSSRAALALSVAALVCGLGIAAYASFKLKEPASAANNARLAKPGMAPESAEARDEGIALFAENNSSVDNATQGTSNGMVRVNIKPWGTIFVDGVSKGVSPPLKKLELAEGKHQIRIENPSFRAQSIVITVTNKKTGVIEHDFSATKN